MFVGFLGFIMVVFLVGKEIVFVMGNVKKLEEVLGGCGRVIRRWLGVVCGKVGWG